MDTALAVKPGRQIDHGNFFPQHNFSPPLNLYNPFYSGPTDDIKLYHQETNQTTK